jgi:thiol-disulfide isomerase/thioredoxin
MRLAGVVLVVALLGLATVLGLVQRRRAGRVRDVSAQQRVSAASIGAAALGDKATLVQFSSAFCRPCVATRHLLADVATKVPGVEHVDVDAESRLELVRELGISSTPTTLLLDADGVVRRKATGVPRRDEVYAALAQLVDAVDPVGGSA